MIATAVTFGPTPGWAPEAEAADWRLERVVRIVNARRAQHGLAPVGASRVLNRVAGAHSIDQARHEEMSHSGSDGSTASERLARRDYEAMWLGENIAAGYPGPRAVMRGWMHSPGHRAIILSTYARRIGVGVAESESGALYWTMVLVHPA